MRAGEVQPEGDLKSRFLELFGERAAEGANVINPEKRTRETVQSLNIVGMRAAGYLDDPMSVRRSVQDRVFLFFK